MDEKPNQIGTIIFCKEKKNYEFPKMDTHKHLHVVIKCTKEWHWVLWKWIQLRFLMIYILSKLQHGNCHEWIHEKPNFDTSVT